MARLTESIRRSARALMLLFVASLIAACDPGYSISIKNDTDEDLTVAVAGEWFSAPAGSAGISALGLGVLDGVIEVADAECRTITTLPVTTQYGIVMIDDDGSTLVDVDGSQTAIDQVPDVQLAATDECIGRVQPAAPAATSEAAPILFIGGRDADIHRIGADGAGLSILAATANWEQLLTVDARGQAISVDILTSTGVDVGRLVGDQIDVVEAGGWGAAISPDGSSLAYLRGPLVYEDGVLFVRGADGTERQIADTATSVTWSPDGRWLAYTVTAPTGVLRSAAWIVRSDGTAPRRVTPEGRYGGSMHWSPDSTYLALAVHDDLKAAESDSDSDPDSMPDIDSDIVIVDVRGSGLPRTLVDPTPDGPWYPGGWSPDGSRLVVWDHDDSAGSDGATVVAVKVDTGVSAVLSDPPEFVSDVLPSWSPDGTQVLFLRGGDGEFFDLWVMDADGSNEHQVVTGVAEAIWQPGGP